MKRAGEHLCSLQPKGVSSYDFQVGKPTRIDLVPAYFVLHCTGGAGNLFNPVKTQRYATVGLHRKTDALDSLTGRVGAFGDFDSDQYTGASPTHTCKLQLTLEFIMTMCIDNMQTHQST